MRGSPPTIPHSTSQPRFTSSLLDTHQDTLRNRLPIGYLHPQSRSPLPLGELPVVSAARPKVSKKPPLPLWERAGVRGSPPGYSTSPPRFTRLFLDTHQDTLRQGLPHWITPPQSRSPLPLGEGPGVRAAPQTPFVLSLSKDSFPRQSRRKTRHRKRPPPPKTATPGPFRHPTPTPYPVPSQAIRKAKRALVSPCLTQHLKLGIWFQVSRPTLSVLQRFRASVAAFSPDRFAKHSGCHHRPMPRNHYGIWFAAPMRGTWKPRT